MSPLEQFDKQASRFLRELLAFAIINTAVWVVLAFLLFRFLSRFGTSQVLVTG